MTVMRNYNDKTQKEIQGTEFAGEEKTEYKIFYDMHTSNSKKVTTMGKKTPKNIIFYPYLLIYF